MKNKTIKENKATITALKERLNKLDTSNETLALLDDDEQNYKSKIQAIESSKIIENCEQEVKKLGMELKSLDTEVKEMTKSVEILVDDNHKVEQIDKIRRDKLQRQNENNTM